MPSDIEVGPGMSEITLLSYSLTVGSGHRAGAKSYGTVTSQWGEIGGDGYGGRVGSRGLGVSWGQAGQRLVHFGDILFQSQYSLYLLVCSIAIICIR